MKKISLLAVVFLTNCVRGQFFITDTVIGVGDTNYEGQDIVALGCTLTVDGPHMFSDVLLGEGAILTHSPTTNGVGPANAEGLNLTVENNFVVDGRSAVRADGLNQLGTGKGVTTNSTYLFGPLQYYLSGSGGGHAGEGGSSLGGARGGAAYGDVGALSAFDMGSSGGAGYGAGGLGGGLINLKVAGVVLLDGEISANGGNGTNTSAGGGAGGAIKISANSILGSGSISANGGMGDPSAAGGGGGGRIILTCDTDALTGPVSAMGGPGFFGGGAGTVFLQASNVLPYLTVDNGGLIGTNTPLSQAIRCNIQVLHGGRVEFWEDVTPVSFFLGSNCVLTAPIGTPAPISLVGLQVGPGRLTIEAGSVVTADGRAAVNPADLAAGRSGNVNNIITGGGGAGMGYGGASALGERGGNVTGQVVGGANAGEGGAGVGQGFGGAGGGSVMITANGPVEIDGVVSAQGNPGVAPGSGGGGGGTIKITAQHLAGSGVLSVNGGAGAPLGGGGGGGSVIISSISNKFTGAITAFGGAGANYGGAGVILYAIQQEHAQVLVDNGGNSGTNTSLNGLPGLANVSIVHGAKAAVSSQQNLQNLYIGSNAFVAPFVEADSGFSQISANGSIVIDAGGGILADGGGYAGGAGPGAGKSAALTGGNLFCGSGGGHGGSGGVSASGAAGGPANDTIATPDIGGSGGGAGIGYPANGGAGGGFVRLITQGLLTLNGFISANGNPGVSPLSGGGAGGAIIVQVGGLAGTGSISANGGAGSLPDGGGGGGGMVAIASGSNSFTGTVTAYGGAGTMAGGAGTIYTYPLVGSNFKRASTLTVDNGGTRGANTPIAVKGFSPQTATYDLQVSGGAVVQPGEGLGGISVNNLLVASNSVITGGTPLLPSLGLSVETEGAAVIALGGEISVDGEGFGGNMGPGAGAWNASSETGGGGGFGGAGGNGAFGAAGGAAYGTSNNPDSFGSGGGAAKGAPFSRGGGLLSLNVKGTLTIDGTVTANGMGAEWPGAGGGSGGHVVIGAESLTGMGAIAANGGAGDLEFGGGGGGGRIVLGSPSNTFAGTISVLGGAGFDAGGIGTIVVLPNGLPQPGIEAEPMELSGRLDSSGGGVLNLTWVGLSAATYQIQWSSNLVDWHKASSVIKGQDGANTWTIPCEGPVKFFRVVVGE